MDAYNPNRPFIHACTPIRLSRTTRLFRWLDENSYDAFIVFWLLFVIAMVGK